MRSSFPGVDPYIEWEGHWSSFHTRFVTYWCDALADVLPDDYEAQPGERVSLIEYVPGRARIVGPDVAVFQRDAVRAPQPTVDSDVALLEPVTMTIPIEGEEVRETIIEIHHRPDETLVAVLELLSPANKTGTDRQRYLDKRQFLLRQQVHLVELDLLLGGQRLPVEGQLPAGHFYAVVSRADRRPQCEVYAWQLPDRLPKLPIPLLPPDADVQCELQAVFDYTYERGRYARTLRYPAPTGHRLKPATREWVQQIRPS